MSEKDPGGFAAPAGWKVPASLENWSDWKPLLSVIRSAPPRSALYRVRRAGQTAVDYFGDTGAGKAGLQKRVDVLRHVHDVEMPYRWPYTSMPALWALRHMTGEDLEISWTAVGASKEELATLKATALAVHRQRYQGSPIANFGRMPAGYVSSSGYNCELMHAGALFRGGPADTAEPVEPSARPLRFATSDPAGAHWGGLSWGNGEDAEAGWALRTRARDGRIDGIVLATPTNLRRHSAVLHSAAAFEVVSETQRQEHLVDLLGALRLAS